MYISHKISGKVCPGLRSKTFATLFFFTFVVYQSSAQVNEDFSDGDFIANPLWNGDREAFIVNAAAQLQLNAAAAGNSALYLDFAFTDPVDVEWQFYLKQGFSPSGGNFGRFYLMSDEPDLQDALDGYYLQFGEPGSLDAIELFRQTGNASVSVCRGSAAAIASAFAARIKVKRSASGLWEVYADYTGATDFVLEASGTDASYTSSHYSGVAFTYTISNATRFYLDDLSITASAAADITAPKILSVAVRSPRTLDVIFSETLDAEAAVNPANYYSSPLPGNPSSIVLQPDRQTVRLFFSGDFTNGVESLLRVTNISDVSGNAADLLETKFLYFDPQPVSAKDIIITEIFPDPDPMVGLPPYEFVEIYNRSPNPVALGGWTFSDGSSTGEFAPYILLPGKYLVVCAASSLAAFDDGANAVSLSNFPTLNNAGDNLSLRSADGLLIDSVSYSASWYKDGDKAEGGWSLELIDPLNICAEERNWTASESPVGGTPGKQNSVFARMPDHTGPKLSSVFARNPTTLIVTFDERLESTVPAAESFTLEPPVAVNAVAFTDASLTRFTLLLSADLQASKNYRLTVTDVYDCPGNRLREGFSQADFVLPEKAVPGDIIVNEILFNPRPMGVDFVEFYNRSGKTIDLKNWTIRNPGASTGANTSVLSKETLLMRPKDFRVFTENANVLKGQYVRAIETVFSEINMPALNDDKGAVTLVDDGGKVIDSAYYDENMHSPFVKENEGISLERISPAGPANGTSNWRSASSAVGFATPGYANSNFRADGQLSDAVTVVPEMVRADGSLGDFTQIKYHFERGGYMANVTVFDQYGRSIRALASNEQLGVEGFFRWDGEGDDGSRVRTGYYMVWFEIFDSKGVLQIFKKRVAVY